jgi:lia operon protein LiaI
MKKFGLFLAGLLAAFILLATIAPMIGFGIGLVILYFIYKKFIKTESTGWKIVLALLGLVVLASTIHNIPALIGLGAAYVLYLVYKNWNTAKKVQIVEESDPFANFEKQWEQFKH